VEATNGLDQAKRQRLGEDVSSVPPQGTPRSILPPGPISIAQLFTLTQDPGPQVFDVHAIPFELVNRILVPILSSIDQTNLDNAVNVCVPLKPNMHSTPEDLLTGSPCQPNFACYLLITSIGCSYPILVSEPAPSTQQKLLPRNRSPDPVLRRTTYATQRMQNQVSSVGTRDRSKVSQQIDHRRLHWAPM